MLTLIALSAVLMQEPPAPPAPPESRSRVMIVESDRPGGLDRDGDGQVSREEFSAPLNDHFARIDKDGDGRLSTDEMAAGGGMRGDSVIVHGGPGGGGSGAGRVELRRVDGPGARSESRVAVFASRGEDGPGEHEIVLRDLSGQGSVRLVHTPGHPGGPGGPGERDVAIHVLGAGPDGGKDLDADKDGRISEAEFSDPVREAFTRMDADRSGFIEPGERGPGRDIQVFTHHVETRQNRED